jgi:hypothetical protein
MSLLLILGIWVLAIPVLTVAVLLVTPAIRDWRVRRHLATGHPEVRSASPLVRARRTAGGSA